MDFTPPDGYEEVTQPEFDPTAHAIGSNKFDPASYLPKLDDAIKSASGDTKALLQAERRRYAPQQAGFTPPSGFQEFTPPSGYEEVKDDSELKRRGKAALGGIEAAATMAGNMPAYIAGGLTGLSRFIATGGDIDKARETQEAVQNSNFGFGAAAPVSDMGKLANEGLQQGQQYLTDKAGDLGEKLGGNLGRSNAEFATGVGLNFMPIPGGKFVSRMAKGIEDLKPGEKPPVAAAKPAAPFTPPDGWKEADVLDQHYAKAPEADAAQVEALQAALNRKGQAPGVEGQGPITVNSRGDAVTPDTGAFSDINENANTQSRYADAQAALEARQAAMEQDVAKQRSLEFNAAERQRQANAPVAGLEDAQGRALNDSIQRTQPYMDESKQGLIDDTDQGYVANQYGGGQDGLRIDENGMPIRADRSMEAQNLENPLQRNLWGDELPRQSAQEAARGITSAIDKMPEGPARTQAMDMLSTNAIEASPELKSAVAEAQRATSPIPRGQRGGLDIDAIGKTLSRVMDKTSDIIENIAKRPISPLTDNERKVIELTGPMDYIPKPDNGPAIAKALTEADGKNFFSHLQSGLLSYGDKVGSTLATTTARWLAYGTKVGERYSATAVRPVARMLTKLNTKDLISAMSSLRDDMFNGKESSVQQLKDMGHSDKAIQAHMAMREAYKNALDKINATNKALGKSPVSSKDAYMASIWDGQWHTPILDKNGNAAWYIKGRTRAEAVKAIEWMKKQPELASKLSLDKAEPKYMRDTVENKVPHDQIGEYQALLNIVGDHPAGKLIKEALEQHIAERGYNYEQMGNHLAENKANTRGFMGDRPWLNDKENALDQAKAQVKYLAKVYNWSGMQEALAGVKELLSHPELNKSQPNNMWMSKAYTAQAMGVSKNIFKPAEQWLQKYMSQLPSGMKFLPSNINKFVGSLKNMTYLTQLGLSGGYMIATPLQAFLLGPARHMQLSNKGFKYNFMSTATKALLDFSSGLVTGHAVTQLGKDAFDYMYKNGVISQNIFNETTGLGENKLVHGAMKGIGWTIAMPEKIARAATFMSFVHHLKESGKFDGVFDTQGKPDHSQMFLRAEELTNHTLTDFRRMSRPLAVDHFGALGELAYTYKSPMFNQYNSLLEFARDAKKGKPGPLLAALGMSGIMGGTASLPLIHELNMFHEGFKWAVAKEWPEMYPAVSGLGLSGSLISGANGIATNHVVQSAIGNKPAKFLADTAAYGLPSAATGSQMSSRFSSTIGDISNPLQNIAPVGQELREWVGASGALAHRDMTGATQAVYDAVAPPAVKGFMETHMDAFKGEKRPNGQMYIKPSDLHNPQASYVRTPDEEFKRNFGLTSLQEANTKNARYISGQESSRFKAAQDESMNRMWGAIKEKNKEKTSRYAHSFFDNNGDIGTFNKELEKHIEGYAFTPEERQIMNVGKNVANIRNYQRQKALREGS